MNAGLLQSFVVALFFLRLFDLILPATNRRQANENILCRRPIEDKPMRIFSVGDQ